MTDKTVLAIYIWWFDITLLLVLLLLSFASYASLGISSFYNHFTSIVQKENLCPEHIHY